MSGNLRLVLLGLLVVLALSAVQAEQEEKSLSQDLTEAHRVARSPEAGKKGNGKSGKNVKGKNKRKRNRKANSSKLGKRRNVGKEGKKRGKGRKRGNRRKNRRNGGKKARRNNQRGLKKNSLGRTTATVTKTCFETSMSCMKIWKDVVSNFERQRKRMIKQNKTGGSKSGKKGVFASTAIRLVDIGGGNRSNMSCGGQYGNKGADQLKNLTDTLFDCEKAVNTSCNPDNIPQPNMTFINNCKALVDNFTKEATICLGKTTGGKKTNSSDSCTCWTSAKMNQTSAMVKNCKASNQSAAITAALKNCTAAFQKCRKYEDAAANTISTCASDSTKLIKAAGNLAANNASMTAAKAKMKSLANATVRAAAASCADIITSAQQISKISLTFPMSPMITTYALKISTSTATCTPTQKASLLTEVTSIETAITSVTSVLSIIQEQILTLTGSTASSSQLSSAVSTAAPSGRRDRIRRQLMFNL